MSQRTKMIMAIIFAVMLTSIIVGASYFLFPSKQSFSLPLSSQMYALILGAGFVIAVATAIGIMLLAKRRKTKASTIDFKKTRNNRDGSCQRCIVVKAQPLFSTIKTQNTPLAIPIYLMPWR